MTDKRFEELFHDATYLEFKNHLYNYHLRRKAIRASIDVFRRPIIEIGSGVSPILPPLQNVIHTDISVSAMRLLMQNKSARTAMALDATQIPVSDGSMSAVVCSEVLEHIPDDTLALAEFARILQPGGQLVITVPTHQYFFSFDDHAVGHYRRYEIPALLDAMRSLGFGEFHVEIVTGLADKIGMLAATALFQAASGRRTGNNPKPSSSGSRLRALLPIYRAGNWLYGRLARIEAHIIPLQLATIVLIRARKAK